MLKLQMQWQDFFNSRVLPMEETTTPTSPSNPMTTTSPTLTCQSVTTPGPIVGTEPEPEGAPASSPTTPTCDFCGGDITHVDPCLVCSICFCYTCQYKGGKKYGIHCECAIQTNPSEPSCTLSGYEVWSRRQNEDFHDAESDLNENQWTKVTGDEV